MLRVLSTRRTISGPDNSRLKGALVALCISMGFAGTALAASASGVSYHGRILKSDGTPLEGSAVQFKMQIRSPGLESCLLYEEIQTLNMLNSSGVFSISLNDGSGVRDDSSGVAFSNVFSNRNPYALPAGSCVSGTAYNPNPNDNRSFVVSFKDENMQAFETVTAQPMNFVPAAIQALQVAGFGPTNLLRVDDATAASNTTPLSTTQFNALMAVANGAANLSGVTNISDSSGNITLAPQPSSGAVVVNSGTASTSVSTGAVQITGDEGVSGAIYAGTSINAGSTVTAGISVIAPQLYGSTAASGNIKIDGTSSATMGNVLLASAGGNVGVGTTSPLGPLDVTGKIYVNGLPLIYNPSATMLGTLYLSNGGSNIVHVSGSDGYQNTAVGINSLFADSTGNANSALGSGALNSNTTGNTNTAVGMSSLYYNTVGTSNTAIGASAMLVNSTGSNNVAVGAGSLYANSNGLANTATGVNALSYNTTGFANTGIGNSAGMLIADGVTPNRTSNSSVYLGSGTMALANGDTNEIVIGAGATGLGANTVLIGNSSIVTTQLSGNVGIGTSIPGAKLDVGGHIANSGSSATLGSCGGGAPAISGNDTRGSVTLGSGGITSCLISFNAPYTSTPFCIATWNGASPPAATLSGTASMTGYTVYFSSSVAAGSFSYHCMQ